MNDLSKGPAPYEPAEGDELELVTAYLNERLSPDKVALVRQRLEEDPEFRALAAPLLLAWQHPPQWTSDPLPPGVLEKHWDRFTKRAGFAHQKRRARRRHLTLGAIALAALGLATWLSRDAIAAWVDEKRNYAAAGVPGEWVAVWSSVEARLGDGARLLVLDSLAAPGHPPTAKLRGFAEFRIRPPRLAGAVGSQSFAVSTPVGLVIANRGEFTVRAAGDTTFVEVLEPAAKDSLGGRVLPTHVTLAPLEFAPGVLLDEGERGILVRGGQPSKVKPTAVLSGFAVSGLDAIAARRVMDEVQRVAGVRPDSIHIARGTMRIALPGGAFGEQLVLREGQCIVTGVPFVRARAAARAAWLLGGRSAGADTVVMTVAGMEATRVSEARRMRCAGGKAWMKFTPSMLVNREAVP